MQQALELKFDTYSLKFDILEKDKQITYSCSQPAEAQNWQDATNDKFKTFSLPELNLVQSDSIGNNIYSADDNQFAVVLLASASEVFSKGNDVADKNLLKELLANLTYKDEIKEVYQDTFQKIGFAESAKHPVSEPSQDFEGLSEQLQRDLEADGAKREADELIKLRQEAEQAETQQEQDIILNDTDRFSGISETNNAGQTAQLNKISQGSKSKFSPYLPKSAQELLEEFRSHLNADIFIYRPSALSNYKWVNRKVGHRFKEALNMIFEPNTQGEFKRPNVISSEEVGYKDEPTIIYVNAEINYDQLLHGFESVIDKAVNEGKVHYKDYLNLAQRSDTVETLLRIRRHIMYGISLDEPFNFAIPEFSEDKNHFVLKLWGGKSIEVVGLEKIEQQADVNSLIVQEDIEDTISKPQQFREVTKTITIPQNAYNMLLKIGDALDGKMPATDALFQIYEIAKAEGGKVSSKPERRDETTSLFYRNYTNYIETCNNAVITDSKYHPNAEANRRIVPSFWVQRNKLSEYSNSRGASATFENEGESKPSNNIS